MGNSDSLAKELNRVSDHVATIQAQLEGLFRQMYQACTQRSLGNGFHVHVQMVDKINELFSEYRQLFEEGTSLLAKIDSRKTQEVASTTDSIQ